MDRNTAARVLADVESVWWVSPDELEKFYPDAIADNLLAHPVGQITAEQIEQALKLRRDDPRWAE